MTYDSALSLLETEIAIKYIKDYFELELAKALNLTRVSAPLFVFPETGLNDNLNGFERAVRFDVLDMKKEVEIVQSLAKWKRMALAKYGFSEGTGLYTDMNAIRRDETLDALHSVYVDQWDWEKIINKEERTFSYLKKTVNKIYKVFVKLSKALAKKYPLLKHDLPEKITFVSTSELEKLYPDLSRKERENAITKKYGAVFLHKIGWNLKDGKPHDGRAADYDDWKLNGDILLWYEPLNVAFEVSSMGVRVDGISLIKQLKQKGELSKLENPYCKDVLEGNIPLTIGGGIGQSRLCMYFLNKMHIGEVQSSVWPESMIKENLEKGIVLL
ncbi:MAG: aspartate--ammonia ligase [Clostridia bacterium]|nr:aspartate--ammonia ligase [Clostridia bacterium]